MKMKSFAMLAMSGLLAASLGYAAPVLADDTSNGDQATQQNVDNSSTDQAQATDNDASQSDSSSNTSGSASSTDGGSPDTATGDDDY